MQFIENKYPERDLKTDIDFTDDIIYTELTGGDELDRYNSHYIVKEVKPAKAAAITFSEKKKRKFSSINVYVGFIIITIIIILIWYFFGSNKKLSINDDFIGIPKYNNSEPKLYMTSPDFGLNTKFRRI